MPGENKIVILSNVFDQHYHDLRGEEVLRSLGSKRQVLFECLEKASGREVIVLSSPPRAEKRRLAKWLPAVETKFVKHRQFFCANWDVPKLRVPLSWFFYAHQVVRHVRSGDLVMIDNYEFLYVFAAWWLKLFRRVTFILDYEDGKHLIEHLLYWRVLGGLAEMMGRPLLRGALLAHPALNKRLPPDMPMELVPGFVPEKISSHQPAPGSDVRFLYSGTLDSPRGVDLLLDATRLLPPQGWQLDITGHGPLVEQVVALTSDPRYNNRVRYHQALPLHAYEQLKDACHVGLNCQRTSDPISGVTFPSKVFTYLSAGLLVVSSRASEVDTICGKACFYYDAETPEALAATMTEVIKDFAAIRQGLDNREATGRFTAEATAARLKKLLRTIGWLK